MLVVSSMCSEFYLLTFNSTHEAMDVEVRLKENDISNKIIPLPTQISASCGLSIKVIATQKEKLYTYLNTNTIGFNGIYFVTQINLNKTFQEVSIGDLK